MTEVMRTVPAVDGESILVVSVGDEEVPVRYDVMYESTDGDAVTIGEFPPGDVHRAVAFAKGFKRALTLIETSAHDVETAAEDVLDGLADDYDEPDLEPAADAVQRMTERWRSEL